MGNGDDLNIVEAFAEYDGVRVLAEDDPLRSVKIGRIQSRPFLYAVNRQNQFFVKAVGGLLTLAEIPRVSGLKFGLC